MSTLALSLLAVSLAVPTAAADTPVVAFDDQGCWISASYTNAAGDSVEEASAWIDFLVQNWSYDKDTGIVYTTDGWATASYADAWYEASLSDGRERWGLDLVPAATFTWNPQQGDPDHVQLEYAIYYTVGGTTWWDNNGGANYVLNLKPGC